MAKFVIGFTLLVVIGVGFVWAFGQTWYPSSRDTTAVRFVIEPDQSASLIAANLSKHKLIPSKGVFLIYALLSGDASRFKPGAYSLSASLSVRQIVSSLAHGPSDVSVVFYPGMTIREMDAHLAKDGIINEGDLEKENIADLAGDYSFLDGETSLEGYLLPDTYYVAPHAGVGAIIRAMLDNFQKKIEPMIASRDDARRDVIIASLIEKEVKKEEDKPLVASVIYNRLKLGMPLQIDAAVRYGACDGVFAGCSIGRDDFKIDTPYNTYLHTGLPPTPISNPSISSIRAALSPASTDYLYYLSDSSGNTYFSSTLDEHNDLRAKYLKL